MPTKTEITNELNNLKKFGYTIINMNTPGRMYGGLKNLTDYIIFNAARLYFVEVKIGKDILSEGQKDTKQKLESIAGRCPAVKYMIITNTNEAKALTDCILNGSY
jgi:hypothetical protein